MRLCAVEGLGGGATILTSDPASLRAFSALIARETSSKMMRPRPFCSFRRKSPIGYLFLIRILMRFPSSFTSRTSLPSERANLLTFSLEGG